MRVNTKPRHKNAPRLAEKSAPQFLQWLRGRECFVAADCDGKIEAAHTYGAGDKGIGTKSSDRYAIPLCSAHHAEQHRIGWKSFEDAYLFRAPFIAEGYFKGWPGRIAWERKLEQ